MGINESIYKHSEYFVEDCSGFRYESLDVTEMQPHYSNPPALGDRNGGTDVCGTSPCQNPESRVHGWKPVAGKTNPSDMQNSQRLMLLKSKITLGYEKHIF